MAPRFHDIAGFGIQNDASSQARRAQHPWNCCKISAGNKRTVTGRQQHNGRERGSCIGMGKGVKRTSGE